MPREDILAAVKASRGVVEFPVPELKITHLRPLTGNEMATVRAQPEHLIIDALIAATICDEDGSRPLTVEDAPAIADAIFHQRLRSKVLEINRATKEAAEEAGKGSAATPN